MKLSLIQIASLMCFQVHGELSSDESLVRLKETLSDELESSSMDAGTGFAEENHFHRQHVYWPLDVIDSYIRSTSVDIRIKDQKVSDKNTPAVKETIDVESARQPDISTGNDGSRRMIDPLPANETIEGSSKKRFHKNIMKSAQDSVIFAVTELLVWSLAMLCIS